MTNVVYNMADTIDSLPTDKNPPSQSEAQLLDVLFKEKPSITQKLAEEIKDVIVVGLLFALLSLPQLEPLFLRYVPSSTSPYVMLGVKMCAFMFLYFLYKNWRFMRK